MRDRGSLLAILAGLVLCGGCRPTLDDRPWLVTKLQLVGWKADPPEVTAGGAVSLQSFALDPAGSPETSATSWTLCHAPKPLGENRVVSPACLAAASPDAVGDPVQVTIPPDACRVFGPDVPQPAPGEPPTRPRDPDATGGYYQPLTISLGAALAVGLERVTCDLPDASLATSRAFQAAYQPNQNPTITGLSFTLDGAPVEPAAIPPGARITIEANWPAGTAETFPLFDRGSAAVVETEETLVATWYVTGGELERASTTIASGAVLSTATDWTAPLVPTSVELAFILSDSRGGSDVARADLVPTDVSP